MNAAVVALVLVIALIGVGAACARDRATQSAAPGRTTPERRAPVDYRTPGPYVVGFTELDVGSARPTPTCAPQDRGQVAGCEPPKRRALVFYPAKADGDIAGQQTSGYRLGDAFAEPLRALLPAEIDETVTYALPVHRDAPANDEAPFPLVLHSHDTNSDPRFDASLLIHLASWGFVVAAPEHPARSLSSIGNARTSDPGLDDLRDTLSALRRANVTADQPLEGTINFEQAAVTGAGAGAATAIELLGDPVVDAAIGWSPEPPEQLGGLLTLDPAVRTTALHASQGDAPAPMKPTLLIAAANDAITPATGASVLYEWLRPPKRLALIAGAGHSSFNDLCPVVRKRGGYRQYAYQWPALVSVLWALDDGCAAHDVDPLQARGAAAHLTVAQLRWVFGFDDSEVSLSPSWLRHLLGDVLGDYAVDPPA